MKDLLKKEGYYLMHNTIFHICLLISICCGIFTSNSYIYDLGVRKDAIGIFDAMTYDSTVWLVVFSAIMTLLIGQEFTQRTISHEIFAGHSRTTIFLSKCFIYDIVFNLLMILFPISGSLSMFFTLGIQENGLLSILHILKVLSFSILFNSAVLSICIFIVFCFKDIAKSITVAVIILFFSALLIAYGNPLGWFIKVPFLRFLPMNQIRIILQDTLSVTQIFEALISGSMWIFLFITITLFKFQKCELK